MKSKTEKILIVLQVLAWMGVAGYAINFGSQLISFVVSVVYPGASKQIPGVEQNVEGLLNYGSRYYLYAMSFVIVVSAMYVSLWYQVATLLSKLNINSPFTIQVAKKIETIAWQLFSIWLVGFIGGNYIDWLAKKMGQPLNILSVGNEILFTAGIVYIISQIFKHGIEIQEENLQTI